MSYLESRVSMCTDKEVANHSGITPSRSPKVPAGLWPCLLIAMALAPSAIWIVRDRSVWRWDPSWYGEVAVELWFALGHSLRQWCVIMATGLYMKPPGIVWIAQFFVPLGQMFGSVEAGLLLSVFLTQFLLLFIIFRIGQEIFPHARLVPVAGVAFAASTQLFVGLSHQLFAEPLQALAVAWSLFVAVKAATWPKPRIVLHLAGLLIVGALAKATTPVYFLLPCIYTAFVFLRRPKTTGFAGEWRSASSRFLIVGCGFAGIAGAVWYAHNFSHVWQHARDSSSGDIALAYGFRASLARKLTVWLGLFNQSFLAPYLQWMLIAAVAMALIGPVRLRPGAIRNQWSTRATLPALLSALQVTVVLLAFSANDAVEPRYMYALLPYVAILVMSLCAWVPMRSALIVPIALAAFQWIVVNRASLGPGGALANQSAWLSAVDSDPARYDELTRVVQATSTIPYRYNIVGVEEPWFNANSASFFAAKNRLKTGSRCYYTSLGYAEKDAGAALRRIDDLQTHYFITRDEPFQPTPPDPFNLVSLPVLRELRESSRFKRVPFGSHDGVLILERTMDPK